ncbi:hypothetical protein SAMN04487890_107256 [Mucilaginibacter polytrichastri]|nr:hypothetical protein SAMN04487890_107256 [Mucilaginibacter polytrichastri]
MNEQDKISRRAVIGGLGATLATAAVSPVIAATENIANKFKTYGHTTLARPNHQISQAPF